MSNMADRIKAHNNKILNQETLQSITDSDQEKCNCRQKGWMAANSKTILSLRCPYVASVFLNAYYNYFSLCLLLTSNKYAKHTNIINDVLAVYQHYF